MTRRDYKNEFQSIYISFSNDSGRSCRAYRWRNIADIAKDFNVSLSSAGQLITIFAFTYAIAGPVLLIFTSKVERKNYILFHFTFF